MMKRLLPALVVIMSMQAEAGAGPGWELVWSDEFDVDGLPDPARWTYEHGFVRNQEAQFYTRERLENARVEGGRLIIEARREAWPNPRYQPGATYWAQQREEAQYTSAAITTEGLASFLFGRIEVRAKVPEGRGVWPAIWTLGESRSEIGWPRCGEIDIMEFVGHDPTRIHGNIHFFHPQDKKHASRPGKLVMEEPPCDDFHIYAIEWTAEQIDFFVDDHHYHRAALDVAGEGEANPFRGRRPHYLLLNLAIGGTWGGEVDPTIFPRRFEVDYVRYYRRAGAADHGSE